MGTVIILAVIGAVVGFVRSNGDPAEKRILSTVGGAFIALLIAAVFVRLIGSVS